MRAYIEESLYKKKLTEYKMRLKVNIKDEKKTQNKFHVICFRTQS